MEGIREGRVGMWIMRIILGIEMMIVATGVDDFARAQNGAAALSFAIAILCAWTGWRQLFANTFREPNAAAGTRIAFRPTKPIQPIGVDASLLRAQKVGVVFDVLRKA